MIVKFMGQQTTDQLFDNINTIMNDITSRTKLSSSGFKLRTVELGFVFNVDGEDKFLTVNHDGIEEIFQINVQLEQDGTIKKAKDNEDESFQDDFTRSVMRGEDFMVDCPVIESEYNADDLIELDRLDGGDTIEVRYKHKQTNEIIYQYFFNNVLVGEMAVTNKE